MTCFMVQITTNITEVNRILNKYLNFMNYFLDRLSKQALYIESIMEGFLVIWRDFQNFARGFQPFPEQIHFDALRLDPQCNPLVKIAPPKNRFPPDGFQITFNCIHHSNYEQFADIVSRFFRSIDSGLNIIQNDSICKVIFPEYEHIVNYLNHLYLYFELSYGLFGQNTVTVL
jgi:hypothetical protein